MINEDNMTSVGWCKCFNFWTCSGQYDLYIVFHELEGKRDVNAILEEADETIHLIMKLNHPIEKRLELIKDIISGLSEYGYAMAFVNYHDRKEGR